MCNWCVVRTDADIDKIHLEIQAGSGAASKIIHEVNSDSEEEDESSPYEDIKAKLKKILGIEKVFKVRGFEHGKGEYFCIDEAKNSKFHVESQCMKSRMGLV